jgi:hypothetical protein
MTIKLQLVYSLVFMYKVTPEDGLKSKQAMFYKR